MLSFVSQFLVVIYFSFFLLFSISLALCFLGTNGTSVQVLGVCYEPCQSRQFSISPVQLFSCYLNIGDNVCLKFGGMRDTLHTLFPLFCYFSFVKKKKKEKKKCMFMLS
jgi:hypothetical protein